MHGLLSIGSLINNTFNFCAHKHPCWEIIYYTHGKGILTIGSQKLNFEPGDIICQPPHITHSESSEKGFRNIHFTITTLDLPQQAVQRFRDNETGIILNLLTQLHVEFNMHRNNWKNISEALLNLVFHYMKSFATGQAKNAYAEIMENTLISNISNSDFNIKDIMKNIPFSKDHARRIFIKETGMTPTQYLMEKRIEFSKQIIISHQYINELNFKEIAFQTGFKDPFYFSRVFKKLAGKSPTEWYKLYQR